jgi:hypothetical protein
MTGLSTFLTTAAAIGLLGKDPLKKRTRTVYIDSVRLANTERKAIAL